MLFLNLHSFLKVNFDNKNVKTLFSILKTSKCEIWFVGLSAYLGDQGSMTGQVGTLLYAAPELDSKVEKAIYNQKVDIYSLGIILFEMSYGPLNTGMERVQVLINLRKPEIEWPSELEETMPNVACLLK